MLTRIAAILENVKKSGDGYTARCPAHDDRRNSLSVRACDDGRILLKCHAGCATETVVEALGLSMSDLAPPKGERPQAPRRIVATYPYLDENGTLLFEAVRYEPKEFRQRRPDGKGGYLWNLQGVRRVLYRLPELLAAIGRGEMVFLVEGEKDADALHRLGLVATCNAGGAGKWLPQYTESLRGANVVLLPDNDAPGKKHVQTVGTALQGVAASVRVVEPPGLPPKGDVSDWLSAGGSGEELRRLAEAAPMWQAPPVGNSPFGPTTTLEERPLPSVSNLDAELAEFPLTDLGNSERLVRRFGAEMRYCAVWGRWLLWDGVRWVPDETGQALEFAKKTARRIYAEAAVVAERDKKQAEALVAWAKRSESRDRLQALLVLAQPCVAVRPGDLDSDSWLLNVANGTLDLRTGSLRPHRREDLLTKLAPVSYDPNASADAWRNFLQRVLPDDALRAYVQRACGYALTGDVREQCLFFAYGTGANGKSTLLNALMDVFGDYACQAAPDLLVAKEGAHPTEQADLLGKRLVATIEVEDGRRLAEGLVKQLTGGDRMKARFMRQDFFEFRPTFKLFFAANHRPVVKGTDYAIWRRIKMIPFEVTIPDEEKDKTLPQRLQAEASGILNWLLRGCLDWQAQGLQEPEAVKAATDDYRSDMDTLGQFLTERCVQHPQATATARQLYEAYATWAESSGERALTQRRFGTALTERGFDKRRNNSGAFVYVGIGLRSGDEPPENPAPSEPLSPKNSPNAPFALPKCHPQKSSSEPLKSRDEKGSEPLYEFPVSPQENLLTKTLIPKKGSEGSEGSGKPSNQGIVLSATDSQLALAKSIAQERTRGHDHCRKPEEDRGSDRNANGDYYGALAEVVAVQWLEAQGFPVTDWRPLERKSVPCPDARIGMQPIEVKATRPGGKYLAINERQRIAFADIPGLAYLPAVLEDERTVRLYAPLSSEEVGKARLMTPEDNPKVTAPCRSIPVAELTPLQSAAALRERLEELDEVAI